MLINRKCCCHDSLYALLLICSCLTAACDKPQGATVNKKVSGENASENTQTLPSGLKYQILNAAPADAKKPVKGQQVVVHYTGWLDENGKPGRKFDSSVDRGEKFTFTIGVGQVIKGWDEGVLDMQIGEKRRLIVPPQLGYGAYGAGGVIPGNATLIFDVELFDVR